MRKKILWLSDLHLEFLPFWRKKKFIAKLKEEEPDALIISGDIADGHCLINYLKFISNSFCSTPIYFVLGNHCIYGSSFETIHNQILEIKKNYTNLHWLTAESDPIKISEDTCIIGTDGWYDARLGQPLYTIYNLDWIMIDELRKTTHYERLSEFRKLADSATKNISAKLDLAFEKYKTIYIVTHVPPWAESTRALGTPMENFWLPYNVNSGMGKMLEDKFRNNKDASGIVLSGHTHMQSNNHILSNLECLVLEASYFSKLKASNRIFV